MDLNCCRFCHGKSKKMLSILQSHSSIDTSSILMDLCKISITSHDDCPSKMCEKCFDKIKTIHNFKQMCQESQQKWDGQKLDVAVEESIPVDASFPLVIIKEEHIEEEESSSHFQDDDSSNSVDKFEEFFKKPPSPPPKKQQKKTDERSYTCSFCGKSFLSSYHCKDHELAHLSIKDWECDACGQRFRSKKLIKYHFTRHHISHQQRLANTKKNHVCKICNKKFALKFHLESHSRVHTGEKPYKCTFADCDKAYSHRIDLKRHTQSHTGKYSFTCEYPNCGKGYSKKSAFDSHQSTHTGQMLYKCIFCNQQFRASSAYTKHVKIHEATQMHKHFL